MQYKKAHDTKFTSTSSRLKCIKKDCRNQLKKKISQIRMILRCNWVFN